MNKTKKEMFAADFQLVYQIHIFRIFNFLNFRCFKPILFLHQRTTVLSIVRWAKHFMQIIYRVFIFHLKTWKSYLKNIILSSEKSFGDTLHVLFCSNKFSIIKIRTYKIKFKNWFIFIFIRFSAMIASELEEKLEICLNLRQILQLYSLKPLQIWMFSRLVFSNVWRIMIGWVGDVNTI